MTANARTSNSGFARRFSVSDLVRAYEHEFRDSRKAFETGRQYFPNGVSQFGRSHPPFPLFMAGAEDARLHTVDGRSLVDFWQGHFVNLFGHAGSAHEDIGTSYPRLSSQIGCNTPLEQLLAGELCRLARAEQAIFCTTGAQATMLATLIALAHTGRKRVLKISGGWHGMQPWSVVAVRGRSDSALESECGGVPEELIEQTVTVSFNDTQKLEDVFKRMGSSIGVVIAELVLGNCGMEMASREFVAALRRNATEYGAVLVFDEIVTGFRCGPFPLAFMYGVEPDLTTLGKIVGGGLPFAAIVGRADILQEVRSSTPRRVMADLGTFTSHPATLAAALATLKRIAMSHAELYAGIMDRADLLRAALAALLAKHAIPARITGERPDASLPNFPIMTIQFSREQTAGGYTEAVAHWDTSLIDIELRDVLTRLAMAIRGYFVWQGAGVVVAAHSNAHVYGMVSAYDDWFSTWRG